MITIEHNYTEPLVLDEEEAHLSTKMKEAARFRQASMTRWYIDKLSAHIRALERQEDRETATHIWSSVTGETPSEEELTEFIESVHPEEKDEDEGDEDEGKAYLTTGPGAPPTEKEAEFLRNLKEEDVPKAKLIRKAPTKTAAKKSVPVKKKS